MNRRRASNTEPGQRPLLLGGSPIPAKSRFKEFCFLLLFLFYLPFYLITSFTGFGLIDPSAWYYRRVARRRHAYATPKELRKRTQQAPGTFIIDHPSPGMGLLYVWWAPDDVLALALVPPPSDHFYFEDGPGGRKRIKQELHPFDQWLWETYLDPEKGKALKVGIWNLRITVDKLQRQFPQSAILQSWSGVRIVLRPELL